MLDNKRNYIKLLNLCNLNPIDLSVKFPFDHITRHLDNWKALISTLVFKNLASPCMYDTYTRRNFERKS